MIRPFLISVFLVFNNFLIIAQENVFEFGKVSYAELDMRVYEADTSATAVVLNEFGEAFFDLESLNKIIFQYHIKIKVLKEQGKKYADFQVLKRKLNEKQEAVRSIRASSFNRDGNTWKESALQAKNIFNENVNEDYSITKFAVPDVQAGSVIEVFYEFESPFTFNFIPWEFQADIPKVKSEFWAKYPAYYSYNITLKGFLKLVKNEHAVIKSCVITGSNGLGGNAGADCTFHKFAMDNIPAFKEEKYLTAKKNYLSAVNFELSQITQLDGRVTKYTTEWADAEVNLRTHTYFGDQIKKGRNLFEDIVKEIKITTKDQLNIAKAIHEYFKRAYTWNGNFGIFTDVGLKKCYDLKKGNIADINLSMLAALQLTDIYAEPVLISTRSHGLPIMLHPVLTDFNYVLVRVKIDNKFYFLDATNPLYTFGFLPENCLNGQGRALGQTSAWIDLIPNSKERTIFDLKLTQDSTGTLSGSLVINYSGYAAVSARRYFYSHSSHDSYIQNRKTNWEGIQIEKFNVENESDLDKPFIEKIEFKFEDQNVGTEIIYLQPFIFNQWEKNPFVSTERLYPVDLGAPIQEIYLLGLEIDKSYFIEDLPKNVSLSLPASGGAFLFGVSAFPNKINFSSNFALNRSSYSSNEYHYLRELFTQYISVQQSLLVLKKK